MRTAFFQSTGKHLVLLSAALLLAGCATNQFEAERTYGALPTAWSQAAPTQTDAVTQQWWQSFGSAEMNALVEQAQTQSLDIAAATARVQQAQASAVQAGAALLPEVIGTADASRNARLNRSASTNASRFGVGIAASYELDFWGRNKAAHDAARLDVQASEADRSTVQLTVTAAVANAWLQATALQERIAIARNNHDTASRLLRWLESRHRAGAATALELAQQRGLVAAQQRQIAALEQQMEDARTAISVLLGSTASQPQIASAGIWFGMKEPSVNAGVPSDLLARRPDIARAESQLASANANVQAARAAMLPRLTLSAGIGTGGDQWRRMFDQPLYNLAANLVTPIFDAGSLRAGTELAIAQREELLAQYRQSIVAAWADVELMLNAVQGLEQQSAALSQELEQAERALKLAERRHAYGADTLLPLLDAQRTLYAAQDAAVQLKLARLQARVGLYKALGGGWNITNKNEEQPA